MFELDREVRNWRTSVERGSSLSPRELDELEDHLRALVDLELELDASLAPRRAFAIARHALGEPKALSREFARAGRPRWKPLLAGAAALYVASLLLPVFHIPMPWGDWTMRGYEMFTDGDPVPILVNLWMFIIVPVIWRHRRVKGTWLAGILGLIGAFTLGLGVAAVIQNGPEALGELRPGY